MARRVLPVQPLEGLISKTEYMKLKHRNDFFDSYFNIERPSDLQGLYLMLWWNSSSPASLQPLEGLFSNNEHIKHVAKKWVTLVSGKLGEVSGEPKLTARESELVRGYP